MDSSITLHTKLYERHTLLSFYCAREEIVAKIIGYCFTPGEINSSNILSKHQGHVQIYSMLQSLLFLEEDAADILKEE